MKLYPTHVLGAVALAAATLFTAACEGDGITQPAQPAAGAAEAHAGARTDLVITPKITARIAFASSRDGDQDIYTIKPDGTGLVQVTDEDDGDEAGEIMPAWGRKQEKLSFVTDWTIENDNNNLEIFAISPHGTNEVRLTFDLSHDLSSAWSPNGEKIAFTSGRGGTSDVWVMNADGTGLVQLTSTDSYEGDPTWSPDGKKIAYVSSYGGLDMEIWVMNADGTAKRQITRNSDGDTYPHWSPDGEWIAFTSSRHGDNEIYRMRPDGSGVVRLTSNPAQDYDPTWSPDGKQIAFVTHRTGNSEIFTMNADGGHLFNVTQHPGPDAYPTWSR